MRGRVRSLGRESVLRGMNEGPTASADLRAAPTVSGCADSPSPPQIALRQSHKMEALLTMAGGIAHDINNILGPIIGYGELAQQCAPEGSAVRRYVDNIMLAAYRAHVLADRILSFSRSGLAERAPIAVQSVVAEALELLEVSLPENICIEKALLAPHATVIGDDTQLHQVTSNLCTNALHAMPYGGILQIRLEELRLAAPCAFSRGQLDAGAYVRLSVIDGGVGIPTDVIDRIFDPFFTTKPQREGTGLGLSQVDGIVADFGGAIEVSSVIDTGTAFRIWLPVSSDAACEPLPNSESKK